MKEKRYFAGANTTRGFVSYYNEIFRPCGAIYVIKGGPGTGKSRLMREAADLAEREGAEVEYFYCSFDPLSLDGIIINKDVAVIDGTAPHVYEPTLVGAKENLIDLGAFWDEGKLRGHIEEIRTLMSQKKHCFDMAYSFLSLVGSIDATKSKVLDKYIERDKICANASKMVSEINVPESEIAGTRIISALGRSGRVRFDTFFENADQSIALGDHFGEGHIYLDEIRKEANRQGITTAVSYDPMFSDRLNAVMAGDTCFFIDENERCAVPDVEELDTQIKAFVKKAEVWLERASRIHFSLEKLYVDAMDFARKEALQNEFISKLKVQIT